MLLIYLWQALWAALYVVFAVALGIGLGGSYFVGLFTMPAWFSWWCVLAPALLMLAAFVAACLVVLTGLRSMG
jgi:hypothetical protein